MKHIYLCGPVTGRNYKEALNHFGAVSRNLRKAANSNDITISITNPMVLCAPDTEWHKAMRVCISELATSDGMALLQGWQRSRGATLELKLAQDLHIPVVFVEPPIDFLDLSELFTAAPETLRYYNARLTQFYNEGAENSLAENRAVAELVNRYLDPYGFEYIEINEGE